MSGQTYIARATGRGEVMVISPCGRMCFMGLWAFIKFAFRAARDGDTIEVQK